MSCNCTYDHCNCGITVKSTSIEADATSITINIPKVTLRNKQPLCVILAQNIPSTATPDMQVIIKTEDFKLTLISPRGNFIYGDQLLTRRMLRTRVATDTLAAVLTNCSSVRCSTHVYEPIPAPVAP